MKNSRDEVLFYLNGGRRSVKGAAAFRMLSTYLRDGGLTGTKVVCAEGDCGACTVLIRYPRSNTNRFVSVNSCIVWLPQVDGASIVTVDGLSSELTPVQEAMVRSHGSQCGFCTPGFVMALTGLVEKRIQAKRSREDRQPIRACEAKNALTGNLCRCTGYQPIIEAAESIDLRQCDALERQFYTSAVQKELMRATKTPLQIQDGDHISWCPTTLRSASDILAANPEAKLLAAGTDLGVFHNKWKTRHQKTVSLQAIPALYEIKEIRSKKRSATKSSKGTSRRFYVGARVTLAEVRRFLKARVPEMARFLDLFASPQIKNTATLVGNLVNASPIGDTLPFLLISDAVVHVFRQRTTVSIPIDQFFKGYRKTALRRGDFVVGVEFESGVDEVLRLYKVSQRKDLDISTVNAAFLVERDSAEPERILGARLALGGVAEVPLRIKRTENLLTGVTVTPEIEKAAMNCLAAEIKPLSDLRASSNYRNLVAQNLLRRFLREVTRGQPDGTHEADFAGKMGARAP